MEETNNAMNVADQSATASQEQAEAAGTGAVNAGAVEDVQQPDNVAGETAADATQAASVGGAAPEAETVGSGPQGMETPYAQQPGQQFSLPPGYMIDPATGQPVFVGQQFIPPQYMQPPGVVYVQVPPQQQQPTPEQLAAQQAAVQQRYGQVVQSVEKFIDGESTVSDVVKSLYLNTSQDDQLWKGILVGAAAAVLLTSGPVREAMGKTFGAILPGLGRSGSKAAGDAKQGATDTTDAVDDKQI